MLLFFSLMAATMSDDMARREATRRPDWEREPPATQDERSSLKELHGAPDHERTGARPHPLRDTPPAHHAHSSVPLIQEEKWRGPHAGTQAVRTTAEAGLLANASRAPRWAMNKDADMVA